MHSSISDMLTLSNAEWVNMSMPTDITKEILEAAEKTAAAARRHGVYIVPYPENHEFVSLLPVYEKTLLLQNIDIFYKVLSEGHGFSVIQERTNLEMAFKILGVWPYDDVFSCIELGDIIEVHTTEGHQVYRNIEMFKVCSFSLVELLGRPWTQLYLRSQMVIDNVSSQVLEVIENPSLGTVKCRAPNHIVTEDGAQRYTIELNFKYISPLRSLKTGQPMGVLTTKTGRVLNRGSQGENISYL